MEGVLYISVCAVRGAMRREAFIVPLTHSEKK